MSGQDEKLLVDIVKDKLLSVIQPQILQLTNLYLVQLVNTGDRVKDGCLIVVFNALVALCMSSLYFAWTHVYNLSRPKPPTKLDVMEIMKSVKLENIKNYTHKVKFFNQGCIYNYRNIARYVLEFKIVDEFYSKSHIYYTSDWVQNRDESGNLIMSDPIKNITYNYDDNADIIIPVHQYMDEKTMKPKYVFFYNCCLVSETFTGLKEFLDQYFIYVNKVILKNRTDNKDTKQIYYDLITNNTDVLYEIRGDISQNITFENIHFDKKPELLEWVNKFKDGKMYPKGLCMSNKLGILLYGPPGTGKTGCISALANYLKRDIVMINSLNLCDVSKTKLSQRIRDDRRRYIFVFDEFDYLLSDKSSKKNSMAEYRDMLLYADADERKQIMEEIKKGPSNKDGPVDQAFLLKMLDGVGENDGRIIIATTNYPEKINPLFLRPGRFDVKLELGYCTYDMFVNICLVKFEDIKNPEYKERIEAILTKNITPLILINTIVIHSSVEELLEKLEQDQEKPDQN
jgi:hypothetical protein